MLDKGKISVRQFMVLVILFTIGSGILVLPSLLAAELNQNAWIVPLLGIGVGTLIIMLYNALAGFFPNMSLVEMVEHTFGKWLGLFISFTIVLFLFHNASALLIYIANFMTTQWMPETPIEFIIILFFSVVMMGTWLGLEVIARSAEIFIFWFLFLFFFLVIFISPQIEWKNVEPVFESGTKPIMLSILHFWSFTFIPFVALLMIFPARVNQLKKGRKAFLIGACIGGIILFIMVILCILVLGPDHTARYLYPSYVLAQKINVGKFVQRIEVIIAIMWILSVFIKMTIYFYGSVIGFAQMLKLESYRFLILPFGMIMIPATLVMHPDVIYLQTFDTEIWPMYGSTFGLLLPLILLTVTFVRKRYKSE
ncbi:GerAB/ArcD/ProY family transporter [Metabacillus bambusae]|uniref:Endospore germination permease n=1 Tax=Metabacillus bambusae TaxID=2795218 RepID=A0ABS3NBL3_9BACI|nr:endospore germination permease [Metabacillus bambusae]MBO1515441.1 endospore germination permease [Metabacillus bambusae]